MNLETFLKFKGLSAAYTAGGSQMFDHVLRDDAVRDQLPLKRLQFDTHEALYSEVEKVCSLLDCSKRELLEMAVMDALSKVSIFFDTYKEVTGFDYGQDHIADASKKGV